ncbi:MAG: FHA domain-containing protein, partial [Acidobacteriota bacterium]
MSNPRLIVLAGPLKGSIFGLTEEEVVFGRESSSRISLADLSTSRRHCRIRREADAFVLTDLESFNGTVVNGLPVKERRLEHGDRITVGSSHFLFLLHDKEPAADSGKVQMDEGRDLTQDTVRIRQEDLLLLQPDKQASAMKPNAR